MLIKNYSAVIDHIGNLNFLAIIPLKILFIRMLIIIIVSEFFFNIYFYCGERKLNSKDVVSLV